MIYRKLVKDIEVYRFQIKPQKPCVKKKMIKKPFTVLWHKDELKVSHVDSFRITKFAGYLSSIYGGLSMLRGEVYDYLVMYLGNREEVKVYVSRIKYLDSVIQEFP